MLLTKNLNRHARSVWQRRYLLFTLVLCVITYNSGVLMYLGEKDYATEFSYPLNLGPEILRKLTSQLRSKLGRAKMEPINRFAHPFLSDAGHTCRNELGTNTWPIKLLFVVKSALDHFERRQVIRQTWAWTGRFSDVEMRRIFLLGVPFHPDPALQSRIDAERLKNSDIVQAAFVDNYYNNTIKTSMGLHWVVTRCPQAKFVMFVDDDYYVSVKNVLRYLRRPAHYPLYLQRAFLGLEWDAKQQPPVEDDEDESPSDLADDAAELRLYTGYVFASSKPHRMITSAWYISLAEYPYDRYPPYVTAGAVLLSAAALRSLYYTSMYTLPFRFDDIYMAILAKKAGIRPLHNPNFYFWKQPYSLTAYTYLIATHGYGDPDELLRVWNEQRTLGNA